MYHQFQMRRALSIFLVLLFGLGPLTAVLTAEDDSRLPACCRRNGAHHCAMSDARSGALSARRIHATSSRPTLTAPAHCPQYPDSPTATMTPVDALVFSPAQPPLPLEQAHLPATDPTGLPIIQIQTHTGRGPPLPTII